MRLEQAFTSVFFSIALFQFHKGAIRTSEDVLQNIAHLHFNSIKVRLERPPARSLCARCSFQFHKGAIRTFRCCCHRCSLRYFNSIKVRLERLLWRKALYLSSYFNSIKVRLERSMLRFDALALIFQFHKGAIRTWGRYIRKHLDINFNSIKVRLERGLGTTIKGVLNNFNSIKVRLEQLIDALGFGDSDLFQFHKGAIRTMKDIRTYNQDVISIP